MVAVFDRTDYAVVVKLRGDPPCPWRWEIYCAGKRLPVERSSALFASRGEAHKCGQAALARFVEARSRTATA